MCVRDYRAEARSDTAVCRKKKPPAMGGNVRDCKPRSKYIRLHSYRTLVVSGSSARHERADVPEFVEVDEVHRHSAPPRNAEARTLRRGPRNERGGIL